MKSLFWIGVAVIVLVAAGVIHIQRGNDTVNITIDKQRLENTAQKVLHEGEQVLEQAEKAAENADRQSNNNRNGDALQQAEQAAQQLAPELLHR